MCEGRIKQYRIAEVINAGHPLHSQLYLKYNSLSLVCMMELMKNRFQSPPLPSSSSSEVTITFQKIAFYYFLPWKFQ